MKTKQFTKKLRFNKQTIASLDLKQATRMHGGTDDRCGTIGCPTFNSCGCPSEKCGFNFNTAIVDVTNYIDPPYNLTLFNFKIRIRLTRP